MKTPIRAYIIYLVRFVSKKNAPSFMCNFADSSLSKYDLVAALFIAAKKTLRVVPRLVGLAIVHFGSVGRLWGLFERSKAT